MTILLAILLLGILILIHELGHFFVGRWAGITVVSFAIGFGPKLFSWTRKGTLFAVRLIPLGGYCQFLGEDKDEHAEGSMLSAPPWKRLLTLLAGPFANILLALIVMSSFLMINGNYVPVVQSIEPISLADDNGLMPGDIIRTVNGKTVLGFFEISEKLGEAGDPVVLGVERDGVAYTITIPRVDWNGKQMLGITNGAIREKLGPLASIRVGTGWMTYMTKSIFQALGDLVTGRAGTEGLVGPVGTINIIAQEVQTGWRNVIMLMAMLSLNVGIFNLLPLPALDGGRIIFVVYQMIRKKPFPPEKEGVIHMVGMALLFGLMLILTFKDVFALFG